MIFSFILFIISQDGKFSNAYKNDLIDAVNGKSKMFLIDNNNNKNGNHDELMKRKIPLMAIQSELTIPIKRKKNKFDSFNSIFEIDPLECTLKNFLFCEKLGEGAYGTVYKVKHARIGKYYAAKELKNDSQSNSNSSCISRIGSDLYRELGILQLLNHSFIAKFHCLVIDNCKVIQIFDHVKGMTMETLISSNYYLSEYDLGIYASELILAIQYLGGKGVSMMDLKPANILIDESGHLKIVDFGFAQSFKNEPNSKLDAGAPAYRSPEMIKTLSDPSNRTTYPLEPYDWYSMGIILYQVFFKRFPFDDDLFHDYEDGNWKEIASKLETLQFPYLHLNSNIMEILSLKGEYDNSIENESEKFPNVNILSKEALNLIRGLLNPNPRKRMNFVNQKILNHPWFKSLLFNKNNQQISKNINFQDKDENKKWWDHIRNKTISPDFSPIFYLNKLCFPLPLEEEIIDPYLIDLMIELKEFYSIKMSNSSFHSEFPSIPPLNSNNIKLEQDSIKEGLQKIKSINVIESHPILIFSLPKGMNSLDCEISKFLYYDSFESQSNVMNYLAIHQKFPNNQFILKFNKKSLFYSDREEMEKDKNRKSREILNLQNVNDISFILKFMFMTIFSNNLVQVFMNHDENLFHIDNNNNKVISPLESNQKSRIINLTSLYIPFKDEGEREGNGKDIKGDSRSRQVNRMKNETNQSIMEFNLILHVSKLIILIEELHNLKGMSWGNLMLENIFMDQNDNFILAGFENSQKFKEKINEAKLEKKENIDKIENSNSNFIFQSRYMPPEMLRVGAGEIPNYKIELIDWYSLGCVIYRMIFGMDPHDIWIDIDTFTKDQYKRAFNLLQSRPFCLICIKSHPVPDESCRKKCIESSMFSLGFIKNSIDLIEKLTSVDPRRRMFFVKYNLKYHSWFTTRRDATDIYDQKKKTDNSDWWERVKRGEIKSKIEMFNLFSNENCKKRN